MLILISIPASCPCSSVVERGTCKSLVALRVRRQVCRGLWFDPILGHTCVVDKLLDSSLLFALAFALGSLFLGLFSPQRFVTPNLYTARNFVSPPPARKVNRLNNLVSHLSQRVTRLHSTMSTDTAPTATDGSEFFRLPRQVTPSHYDLTVLSDLESLKYTNFNYTYD